MRARVTDSIVAGIVEVNMGADLPRQAQNRLDANMSRITDTANSDGISGFLTFKTLLSQFEKLQ